MSFFVSIKAMEMKGSDDAATVNLILMALAVSYYLVNMMSSIRLFLNAESLHQ
jgi:hypothetical protein